MTGPNYRSHDVTRIDRADGSILLRSNIDLPNVADKTTDWLAHWAQIAPKRVFLAERSGAGWHEVTYGEARDMVDSIAASLLGLGLNKGDPILILSGNSVRHGLLTLAAQLVGLPTVPIAEQYSLVPEAAGQIAYFAELTKPAMVFAEDNTRFGMALELPAFRELHRVVGSNPRAGELGFDALLSGDGGVDLAQAEAQTGAKDVVKILTTSGSTSSPKGVPTTHEMMCVNQAQIAPMLPFLKDRPPVLMDWLPWNHVFGGSHNFNLALSNGGALYIDFGKPVAALVGQTIENIRLKSSTIAFNVPVGYTFLRDAMKADRALQEAYFREIDMLFYAGASLPQDVWSDLENMAREVRGDVPMFTSSWGLTETAPAALLQHEPTTKSGVVGVPVTATDVKLLPLGENRFEVRTRGAQNFGGYLNDPQKSQEAFDDEGFFISGDAMTWVDPADVNKGLRFLSRLSEDFKLGSGTWVRAAGLRLDVLKELAPWVGDLVVCGEGHNEVGLILFLNPAGQKLAQEQNGVFRGDALETALGDALRGRENLGSSTRVGRIILPTEPPSMALGEVTAKGNLNFRRILSNRSDLLERLFDDTDPGTIKL